jgi:hypothetical protein
MNARKVGATRVSSMETFFLVNTTLWKMCVAELPTLVVTPNLETSNVQACLRRKLLRTTLVTVRHILRKPISNKLSATSVVKQFCVSTFTLTQKSICDWPQLRWL